MHPDFNSSSLYNIYVTLFLFGDTKMETNKQNDKKNAPHAPGTGSDKHHPETPPNANERFRQDKKNIQEDPGAQNSG
jgi:hypothetical protein